DAPVPSAGAHRRHDHGDQRGRRDSSQDAAPPLPHHLRQPAGRSGGDRRGDRAEGRVTMAKPPYRRQQNPSSWRRLATVTWRAPNDSTVYGTIEVDITAGLDLIERLRREENVHATLTHLVAKALAVSLPQQPEGKGI